MATEMVLITREDLRELIADAVREAVVGFGKQQDSQDAPRKQWITGDRNMAEHFGVGLSTLREAAAGFLAPALVKHGRRNVYDVQLADELWFAKRDNR